MRKSAIKHRESRRAPKCQQLRQRKLERYIPSITLRNGYLQLHEKSRGILSICFIIKNSFIDNHHFQALFEVRPYMERQVCLTAWMRSLLVDWMVEVQESFELNHETLYLGVKLVDYYLSKVIVGKETLQLVGAAAMFIASKYDERIPPLIDDFLYICDGAYTRRELIRMEMNVLKICDFNLGIPISYRFLRRYARVSL